MRVYALLVAASFVTVASLPLLASTTEAQAPIARYSLTVIGETVGGRQTFAPNQILLPQLPIRLEVTFHNNDTMVHTFTINDENGTEKISTNSVSPGQNATVNFTILSMRRILLDNGTQITPEAASGTGILFYCIPHRTAGMTGTIALSGSLPAGTPEKGILLRAYWIGIIGIAATLVWVGISYFVIKSSSRHFKDNREHIRRGLP